MFDGENILCYFLSRSASAPGDLLCDPDGQIVFIVVEVTVVSSVSQDAS